MPRETGKERPACTMAAAEGAVPAHRDASLSRHRKARPAQSARIGAGDDRTRASRLTERRLRMKNSPMTKAANLGHRRGLLLRLSSLGDRKSTRLNSSHGYISYAVFCLKKKTRISNHKRIIVERG